LANTLKIKIENLAIKFIFFVPSVLAIEKLQKRFHVRILNIYFRFLARFLQ